MPYGKTGAVMATYSWGAALKWHPHCHAIALNGVLLDDGAFMPLDDVNTELLSMRFAEKVFAALAGLGFLAQETFSLLGPVYEAGLSGRSAYMPTVRTCHEDYCVHAEGKRDREDSRQSWLCYLESPAGNTSLCRNSLC